MKPFTIDKLGLHTGNAANAGGVARLYARFAAFAEFLDANDLTVTPVSIRKINDDFAVTSEDLTDEGLQLMRAAYDSWAMQFDRGRRDPTDVSLLKKELDQLRGE